MIYSKGFHPKPQLVFAPALGLGVQALGEVCDVRIDFDGTPDELVARLRAAAPMGLQVRAAVRLGPDDVAISKVLARADFAAWLPTAPELHAPTTVTRVQKRARRAVDVGQHLEEARLVAGDEAERLRRELEWPAGGAILVFRTRIDHEGGARPVEVIEALTGAAPAEEVRFARTALWARAGERLIDPLDLPSLPRVVRLPVVGVAPAAAS
jgi:radical SAM-linked protein